MLKRAFFALSFILSLAGSAFAADAKALVEARNAEFVEALAAGDAAGIAALYAEDGMLLPPASATVAGRGPVKDFWRAFIDTGVAGARLTTIEATRIDKNHIMEVGEFDVFDKDGKSLGAGKYVVSWVRRGGAWYLHRDIWNDGK